MVARDALDAEERRIETLRDEIQNRVAQIDADIGREKSLGEDAAEAVENLEREATEIRAAQTREADDLATAKARLLEAEAEVEQRERELTELTRSVVADETGATLNRQLTEFEIRRKRFDDRLANITREKQEAEAAADDNGALDSARKAAEEPAMPPPQPGPLYWRLKAPRPTRDR